MTEAARQTSEIQGTLLTRMLHRRFPQCLFLSVANAVFFACLFFATLDIHQSAVHAIYIEYRGLTRIEMIEENRILFSVFCIFPPIFGSVPFLICIFFQVMRVMEREHPTLNNWVSRWFPLVIVTAIMAAALCGLAIVDAVAAWQAHDSSRVPIYGTAPLSVILTPVDEARVFYARLIAFFAVVGSIPISLCASYRLSSKGRS
jgi:hypothetical protein